METDDFENVDLEYGIIKMEIEGNILKDVKLTELAQNR